MTRDEYAAVFPDPKIFSCIPAYAADVALVNPRGIKTLLANGLIIFFINGNPVLKKIFLIVSSLIIGFLIIWYLLINDLQKLYEDLKFVC